MCGIAGVLNRNSEPVPANLISTMASVIAHRGPDGEGLYFDAGFGMCHRRLSIIDISENGHQPMVSSDGRYAISYNGEVYNFKEIRTELEQEYGVRFKSQTDTEVVLEALAHWGPQCISRFNGMFAFAFWDRKEKSLLIARDRYGIKPLYYFDSGGFFAFGSEIKALLKHPRISSHVDTQALGEYFTFQNIFTDRTLFEGVKLLPAGTYAYVAAKSTGLQKLTTYWDFEFQEPLKIHSEDEYLEELDRLFRQAVRRQLVSDVELGSYLSGGMDSGAITALTAETYPYLKTFTVGFDLSSASGMELAFDERAKSEAMSYLFKTEHYEMVLKSGDMERIMPELTWHLEDPRVGQSYPNYYCARLASKFVKVVLSGAGGDELFAGYPWRYYRVIQSAGFDEYRDTYYRYWQRLLNDSQFSAATQPMAKNLKDFSARDAFSSVFKKHSDHLTRAEDYVNHSLYFEAKTFLHGLLLVEDKLSLAHGLETRVPFLDNDLVDFAMRLPARLKLGNIENPTKVNENEISKIHRTSDGKLILRKLMRRYIPEEVTSREKQGFSAPDASWFRGDSMKYVEKRLLNAKSPIYEFLDKGTITSLVQDHLQGRENRRLLIWSLLSFDEWCRQFIQTSDVASSRPKVVRTTQSTNQPIVGNA